MHAAELRQDHFKNGMFRMYTTDTKFFVSREEEPAADLWSFCAWPGPKPCPGPARSAAISFACSDLLRMPNNILRVNLPV